MGKLSAAKVKSITEPGRYGDGGTLFLYVAPGGSKSWVQRLTINGRRRDIGLGGFPLVSLADARDKAIDNRRLARSGGDPIAASRRASMPTFREATELTLEGLKPTWRNVKHADSWFQTLEKYAFPVLAKMRVDQIQRQDVLRVLKPIWTTRSETARRVRQRIKAVLAWSQSGGFIDLNMAGEVIDGALPSMQKKQKHMRALPYAEMANAMRLIESGIGSPNVKLCLLFTVLTAARGSESRGGRWTEVDFEKRVWSVPAERMKAAEEHAQPLSSAALEVLERARALDDGSGLIFPSAQKPRRSFSNVSMMLYLKRNNLAKRMTVHGCRASFRTWASECTDADFAVMELSLAHAVGSAVMQAYDRAELLAKRRALMEAWGLYVSGCEAPSDPSALVRQAGSDLPQFSVQPEPEWRVRDGAPLSASESSVSSPPAKPDRPEPVALARTSNGRAKRTAPVADRSQLGLFGDFSES